MIDMKEFKPIVELKREKDGDHYNLKVARFFAADDFWMHLEFKTDKGSDDLLYEYLDETYKKIKEQKLDY